MQVVFKIKWYAWYPTIQVSRKCLPYIHDIQLFMVDMVSKCIQISKKVVNPLILTCIWWCRVRSKSVLAEVLTPILTLSSSRGMRGTFVEDFRSGVELKPPFLRPPPLFMTWLCRSAWLVCCFEVGESSAEFDFLDACNWKI